MKSATLRTRQRRAGLLAFSSSCELTRHGSDVASRRRSTRCNGCASGTPGAAEARQILSVRFFDESVRTLRDVFLRKGFRCCRCVDMHCVSEHQGTMPTVRKDGRHTVHPSVGLRRSHHLHMPDCKFLAQTLVEAARGTSCNSLLFARGLLPRGELQSAHEEHSMVRWPTDSGDVRFRPRGPVSVDESCTDPFAQSTFLGVVLCWERVGGGFDVTLSEPPLQSKHTKSMQSEPNRHSN